MKKSYFDLINHQRQIKKGQKEEGRILSQERQNISKQILYNKGGIRLQSRLMSPNSALTYSKKGGQAELFEHFKEFKGVIQEKNLLRQLVAEKAVYSYKSGLLEAKEVEIGYYFCMDSFWTSASQDFPLLFKGHAKNVHFSLSDGPLLKAQEFDAQLYQKE